VHTTDQVRAIFGARLKSLPTIGFYGARPLIDRHCHLLPGFDDGAQNLQTSLTMARAAVDQGVFQTGMGTINRFQIGLQLKTDFGANNFLVMKHFVSRLSAPALALSSSEQRARP
jgi:hypothetical protein